MSGDHHPHLTAARRLALTRALARRLAVGDAVPTKRTLARALGMSPTAALLHRRVALADAGIQAQRVGRKHLRVVAMRLPPWLTRAR